MNQGLRLAFVTAVVSGISVFANSFFASSASDPLLFVTSRNILVAIILTGIVLSRRKTILKMTPVSSLPLLLMIALVGGSLPFALFFMGLPQVGATAGNFLNKTLFLWTGIFAFLYLGEGLIVRKWFSYLLIALALALLAPPVSLTSPGALLVLGATLLWSLEYVLSKKVLLKVEPDFLAWFRITFGLPVLMVMLAMFGGSGSVGSVFAGLIDPKVIVSAVFLTSYMAVWYRALAQATASAVSIMLTFAPVVTVICETVIRSRYPEFVTGLQSLIIITALLGFLLNRRTAAHDKGA